MCEVIHVPNGMKRLDSSSSPSTARTTRSRRLPKEKGTDLVSDATNPGPLAERDTQELLATSTAYDAQFAQLNVKMEVAVPGDDTGGYLNELLDLICYLDVQDPQTDSSNSVVIQIISGQTLPSRGSVGVTDGCLMGCSLFGLSYFNAGSLFSQDVWPQLNQYDYADIIDSVLLEMCLSLLKV